MKQPTLAEMLAWPATVDLVSAGRALQIGRNKSYELARAGRFPCPVLALGDRYVVPTAPLLRLLGIEPPTALGAQADLRLVGGGSDETAA